ncbi:hypothetical protein [Peribacillus frigoritolerans]|uniref:hypothetical protein n=1 Tax=Peribacillus frigoritolerans TaxID=450367 RepID=UPI002E1AD8A3|nr:hypothetical protein [Peribacillus frigoritolerans]
MSDVPKQPKSYDTRGTGLETTISQVFPSVTLAEVKTLNTTATLLDTADWYVLQKLIHECDINNDRRLNFPTGDFRLSKPLDFTGKLANCLIEATGCYLKPASNYNGKLIQFNRGVTYAKSRNLRVDGLAIDGMYRSHVGIEVNNAQEWYFHNIKIYRCFVGLDLLDTWYGEITGEPIIQDCLTGVRTSIGNVSEVNTIDFSNLKINFTVDKRKFISQNVGESDVDYNNRVISIGIELNTKILGCRFEKITHEGMDYGYYGIKTGIVDTTDISMFTIDQNFFEAIKKEAFHLRSFSETNSVIYFNVAVTNSRFFGNIKSTIGQGKFTIKRNDEFNLTILESGAHRTFLDTDLPKTKITSNVKLPNIFIRNTHVPFNANALKYNDYNNNNPYPTRENMLPTIQDQLYIEHIPKIRSGSARRTENYLVLGITSKPLTFSGGFAAPVILGENGKYYMLKTGDGTTLILKEVLNLHRLDYPVGGMESKELYRKVSIEGEKFFLVDIEQEIEFKNGKWMQLVGHVKEMIALGTTSEISSITTLSGSLSFYTPCVWNVQIDSGYNWQAGYWAWGPDWFGLKSNIRAIGTIFQRPTNPAIDGFIYYTKDENKYYKWSVSRSSYSEYSPLF